ncbi:MAG TPA: helix-turn-helix domain-containing protein [Verrucomicrobiae bacterium]|nr:helix-turn-helix domain-containing protein [Verrucomicrobiae bacterium]
MANFGEALKREREQRDIPLRDIANATKINLRYLEALEQNRFDKLPGGVFNKGFIRAYARFIGADGEVLVQRYMEEVAEKEAVIAGQQPSPDRPGALRAPQAPPRRRDGADIASEPATGAGPAITFGETRAAAPAPAAPTAPAARTDFLPPAATVPLRSAGETFQQARLLLAGTTVIAAFAALGTIFYLVRSAQHEPRTETPSHDAAPAGIPDRPDSGPVEEATPASPEPQILDGEKPAPPSGDPASAPSGDPAVTPPGAAGPGSTPPAVKPDARPLPELPRERNGSPSPVRVASPIPAPAPDQTSAEGTVRKPARSPSTPPPAPAPVTVTPPSNAPNPAPAGPVNPPATATAPTGPMAIAVTAVSPVTVILGCDGSDRPARTMLAGETVSMKCYSLVRISAEDAAAVRLSLDGAPCPLGAAGRVEHFTIRAEDARAICAPGAGSGAHGRR